MKKPKFYEIPIYDRSYTICTDREHASEILKFYKLEQIDFYDYAGVVSKIGSSSYLFCVFDGDLNTLNHELTHLALYCMDNGDSYDLRYNQEALAYLIGYLTTAIYPKFGLSTKIPQAEVTLEIKL